MCRSGLSFRQSRTIRRAPSGSEIAITAARAREIPAASSAYGAAAPATRPRPAGAKRAIGGGDLGQDDGRHRPEDEGQGLEEEGRLEQHPDRREEERREEVAERPQDPADLVDELRVADDDARGEGAKRRGDAELARGRDRRDDQHDNSGGEDLAAPELGDLPEDAGNDDAGDEHE